MKSVCKYCGQSKLIKWGSRRRCCEACGRTFSVPKAGRNRSKKIGMYLLDRSTFRRIGCKTHHGHTTIMRGLHQELKPIPTPTDWLKKTYKKLPVSWLLTLSMYRLREWVTVSFWPLIPTLV